jgi:hypothetical protein
MPVPYTGRVAGAQRGHLCSPAAAGKTATFSMGTSVRRYALTQVNPEAEMPESHEYRQHAQECVTLAGATRDPEQKSRLQKMAEAWIELAEQAEHREQSAK